jgi:hypothetical protein
VHLLVHYTNLFYDIIRVAYVNWGTDVSDHIKKKKKKKKILLGSSSSASSFFLLLLLLLLIIIVVLNTL